MPLVSDPESKPFLHGGLRAVGFGMIAHGGESLQRVRVIVTFEALAEVSNVNINRFLAALECFRSFRNRLEAAASVKFDRIGPSVEEYEGLPTVLLMTGDPM